MAKDDNGLETTFAFILGGVVGATLALLFAPASGEETRRKISEAADDATESAREEYGKMRDKAEIEFSRLKDRASDKVGKAKSFYDQKKSRFKEAYNEGKEAFEAEKDELTAPSEDKA